VYEIYFSETCKEEKIMSECFLCKNETATLRESGYEWRIICPNCGKLVITDDLYSDIKAATGECFRLPLPEPDNGYRYLRVPVADLFFKARCVAAERKLKDQDEYILVYDYKKNELLPEVGNFYHIGIKEFLDSFPATHEVLDRALLNLGRLGSGIFGESIYIFETEVKKEIPSANINILYASNKNVAAKILINLKENNFIEVEEMNYQGSFFEWKFYISAKGWDRIAGLKNTADKYSEKAFIAMWFDVKHTRGIREALKKAILSSGYLPIVIDEVPHADFIMNRVINEINEARFVVADFTCINEDNKKDDKEDDKIKGGVRGGVYFEAGYARGQRKKVFHTCRKDSASEKRLHFDIKQINTLFWEPDGESIKDRDKFIDDLKQAIWAEVGKGPRLRK